MFIFALLYPPCFPFKPVFLFHKHQPHLLNTVRQSNLFVIWAFSALLLQTVYAQVPYGPAKNPPAADILLSLKKLNVLGSILYVAAHPDDENTLLLAYMAKDRLARTAYMALTRGDGGQNLIGTEQGEYIGLIRTQELLAARRVDGPEQYFSRAYDFGFSKSTDEAVRTWGRDQVLADVVWRIRKFQPDVIITRFPPDNRAGHGHHSASGFLAEEAFKIANDPTKFPEQLKYVKPWQAKRIMWNVFIPTAFGSNQRPNEAGNLIGIETGVYNPLLGRSYGEIAAESRSQHKSQGFGVSASRGVRMDYLLLKAGEPAEKDPFDGVDMTWKRVPGSERVQELVNQVITSFRPDRPSASVPMLVQLYKSLSQLDAENNYVAAKKQEVETLIQQCLGLWLESNPVDYAATPGEIIRLNTSVVARTDVPVKLIDIRFSTGKDTTLNLLLKPYEQVPVQTTIQIPTSQKISQPYWLEKPLVKGLFQVDDQQLIGLPENPPALTAAFTIEVDGQRFTYTRPWVYKFTDPVDGETYRPFVIQPEVMINIAEKVYVYGDNTPKPVEVILKAGRANVSGKLSLSAPGWKILPTNDQPFALKDKGQELRLTYTVAPGNNAADWKLLATARTEVGPTSGGVYTKGLRLVEYKHIPTQTVFPAAEAKLVKLDVKVKAKNIGYIMGAGDEVTIALRQMGCQVTMLDEAELNKDLSQYDAIVVGVRAYNTEDRLKFYQEKLMEYVRNGGTMIVQYVTAGGPGNTLKVKQMGPYPFNVGRDRVTEEDATMTFLKPQHPLLTTPNKITDRDFDGWIQERGIYFAVDIDKNYETIFASNDTGEAPKEGSLIYAKYGKGHFMYTGLVFFRELPAGVVGAYRLFANMISVGK